jgi:hypothetical protein
MALSAFDEKSRKPRAGDLVGILKRTSTHRDSLVAHIASEYPPLDASWNFAGALPDSVLATIDGATKYAEGRAVRIEIRNKKDLASAKKLAAVKMAK